MLRVRLKADGRLVEVLPDGSERAIASDPRAIATAAHNAARADEARYARNVRGRTGLTQAAFAARRAARPALSSKSSKKPRTQPSRCSARHARAFDISLYNRLELPAAIADAAGRPNA